MINLKCVLEDNFCEIHDIKPVVGISENTLTINCCCQQFHHECVQLAEELAELLELDLIIN